MYTIIFWDRGNAAQDSPGLPVLRSRARLATQVRLQARGIPAGQWIAQRLAFPVRGPGPSLVKASIVVVSLSVRTGAAGGTTGC